MHVTLYFFKATACRSDQIITQRKCVTWVLEDALDGFIQFGTNPLILLAIAGMLLSIAFFNFCGLTVTQQLSATTRMVLDSVRTMIIWIFELILGWNTFQYLQVTRYTSKYTLQ